MVEPLRVGLAGLGTVGSAVAAMLARSRQALAQRTGREPADISVRFQLTPDPAFLGRLVDDHALALDRFGNERRVRRGRLPHRGLRSGNLVLSIWHPELVALHLCSAGQGIQRRHRHASADPSRSQHPTYPPERIAEEVASMLVRSLLRRPDELTREALTRFLARNAIKGDIVAISVPGQSGLTRFVKLPPVEEKKITDIVRFEAKQQIPFPLEEVVWDYPFVRELLRTKLYGLKTIDS